MEPPPPPPYRNGNGFSASSSAAMLSTVKSRTPQPFPGFSTSCVENGKRYSLQVTQQPVRARMCGFGDKDRRPITPPPCIRLVVQDETTQEEIDISEVDTSFFVLTVDLWSADGKREVNLVRHSATSPSISAATSSSYPPPQSGPIQSAYQPSYNSPTAQLPMVGYPHQHHMMMHPNMYQHPGYQPQQYQANPYPSTHLPPPIPISPQSSSYYNPSVPAPVASNHYYSQGLQQPMQQIMSPREVSAPVIDPRASPSGMFTRNLIGSLCVSAFKLTCPENKMGVWFILQDLSVRTEGSFRLKMNFVNVGSPTSSQSLNNGTAPVLASIFSDIFTVYSAKKFPGVIESTDLSKCFALQGIKIPIRKDGTRANVRDKEEAEDS